MKRTLASIAVGAGLTVLLVCPVRVGAGSVVLKEGERIEWVEKRTNYRFHVDKDPEKSGWQKETDTIYHIRKDKPDKGDAGRGGVERRKVRK